MSDGEAVRVAVRVRPFNQREKDRNSVLCIQMNGTTTTITNPENQEPKDFAFDFSYWSHDGFIDDDGLLLKDSPSSPYATQQQVFDDLGRGVMDNAFGGYNSCLFAYGQTGSGKSYSMVGYGRNIGIVPITCDAIFKHIAEHQTDKLKFQVTLQMLEIYNEQVRDLFKKDNPAGGLKVRMNPKIGVEVVGLTDWPVSSYQDIEERIDTATKNRTVAATQMNATSSRAHTVVTISFAQIELDAKGPGKHSEKKAKMNLVDLAGSERAASTGAQGDRLKEGAAINLSLTMLGNCITALAERSMNPGKKVLVPYRESKLTMILQDALGGNSKTIMICALSPADINYDETLSTLRYADRAKKIKNKPTVNVDPTEALIQKLKEENERLKASLGGGGGMMVTDGAAMSDEQIAEMKKQWEAEMADNQRMLEEQMKSMSQSYEERMAEARRLLAEEAGEKEKEKTEKNTMPHILNLHEDPMLSRAVSYRFAVGVTTIGNRSSNPDHGVALSGANILPLHATVYNEEGKPLVIDVPDDSDVVVNGEQIKGRKELHHNDRVTIGPSYYFILVIPTEQREKEAAGTTFQDIDFLFIQRETAKARGVEVDSDFAKMTDEERRKALINDEIVQLLPLVKEANAMSLAMKKPLSFETEVVASNLSKSRKAGSSIRADAGIAVKLTNRETGIEIIWSRDKFMDRVFLIREMWQNQVERGIDASTIPKESDPFWDPVEASRIGSCLVHPQELYYGMAKEDNYRIIGPNSEVQGQLKLKLAPCLPDGRDDTDEELFTDNPEGDGAGDPGFVGKPFRIRVTIEHARGLPSKFVKEVFVKFQFFGKEVIQTPAVGGSINPNFNFTEDIIYDALTLDTLRLFKKESIEFEVWGLQEEKGPGQQAPVGITVETSPTNKDNPPSETAAAPTAPTAAASEDHDAPPPPAPAAAATTTTAPAPAAPAEPTPDPAAAAAAAAKSEAENEALRLEREKIAAEKAALEKEKAELEARREIEAEKEKLREASQEVERQRLQLEKEKLQNEMAKLEMQKTMAEQMTEAEKAKMEASVHENQLLQRELQEKEAKAKEQETKLKEEEERRKKEEEEKKKKEEEEKKKKEQEEEEKKKKEEEERRKKEEEEKKKKEEEEKKKKEEEEKKKKEEEEKKKQAEAPPPAAAKKSGACNVL